MDWTRKVKPVRMRQWAFTVQGAWTSIPLAALPYTEPLMPTNRFFRFQ